VQNFIFKEDSYTAGVYLSKFSELMRMTLDFSRRDLVPLEMEEKFLLNYLELQQLRFIHKFSYTVYIDERILKSQTYVPPMLAQPFLENSIEHGILTKEEPGMVCLSIRLSDGALEYEITDNGVGPEKAASNKRNRPNMHESAGSIITIERIREINKNNKRSAEIEITDLRDCMPDKSGLRVKFSVPYKIILT
jgi:sensor histidine kinase YesM